MHFIGVISFVGFVGVVAVMSWAVKSHSQAKSIASARAKRVADDVSKRVLDYTDVFLEKIQDGMYPEEAAAELRDATGSLIEGRQGQLPSADHIRELANSVYSDAVAESLRKNVMLMVGGTAAVSVVTILLCSILYQFHSDGGGPASLETGSQSTPIEFSKPVMTN